MINVRANNHNISDLKIIWDRVNTNMAHDEDLRAEMLKAGYSEELHAAFTCIVHNEKSENVELPEVLEPIRFFYRELRDEFRIKMNEAALDEHPNVITLTGEIENEQLSEARRERAQDYIHYDACIQGFDTVITTIDKILDPFQPKI